MTENKTELRAWWDARSDVELQVLREAKDSYPLPSAAVVLLIETKCPAVPIGATWTSNENGYAFNMPTKLAELIEEIDGQ